MKEGGYIAEEMDIGDYDDTISVEACERPFRSQYPQKIELNDLSGCTNPYHIIDFDQRTKPQEYQHIVAEKRKVKVSQKIWAGNLNRAALQMPSVIVVLVLNYTDICIIVIKGK